MRRVDSLEKTLILGGIGAGGEGDDGERDGWMASPTRWAWVWINSGSLWWTGRPGVLWFMGSQRVRHDWVTELNWTEEYPFFFFFLEPNSRRVNDMDFLWNGDALLSFSNGNASCFHKHVIYTHNNKQHDLLHYVKKLWHQDFFFTSSLMVSKQIDYLNGFAYTCLPLWIWHDLIHELQTIKFSTCETIVANHRKFRWHTLTAHTSFKCQFSVILPPRIIWFYFLKLLLILVF